MSAQPNLHSLKDRAAELLARSDFSHAIDVLREIADAEPNEGRWPLRAGDVLRHLGRTEDAIEMYRRAVRVYAHLGVVLKAVAVARVVADTYGDDSLLRELNAHAPGTSGLLQPPGLPASPSAEPPSPAATSPADAGTPSYLEIDVQQETPEDEAAFAIEIDEDEAPRGADPESALGQHPLFQKLGRKGLGELGRALRPESHRAGEVLVREGTDPDALYVLVRGRASVRRENVRLANLGSGEVFGEMALLRRGKRRADVVAETAVDLYRIDRGELQRLFNEFPPFEEALKAMLKIRVVQNLLRTAPIFGAFGATQAKELLKKFDMLEVEHGKALLEQGKDGDGLYVVVDGNVRVERDGRPIALLTAGDTFGEVALLRRGAASATVRAQGPALLLRLPRAKFDGVITAYPPILEHLSRLYTERSPEGRTSLDGVALL